ncbi:MAG: SdpI family protein [Parcubacteria group bacterium]|nr:SdpI family protein [Parcubacteria group bacterium]
MNKKHIGIIKEAIPLTLIFIMAVLAVSLFKAPCLADKLPSHWNAAGEIDGYSGKSFVLIFYPLLTLGVYLLMLLLPKIDPFRKNYEKFKTPYYFMRLFIVVLFFALYCYTLLAAIGYKFNIMYFMIPTLSLLFSGFGFIMPKIKRNYFVGIRTPWTLQSDEVWERTHKFGGKAFIVGSIIGFLGIFFGENGFWIFIIAMIAASLIPLGYSYWVYRKLGLFKKKG